MSLSLSLRASLETKTVRDTSSSSGESSSAATSGTDASPSKKPRTCSNRWTGAIKSYHGPLMKGLLAISRVSARHPRKTIGAVIGLSLLLVVVGFLTNFNVEVSENKLWTPSESLSRTHKQWISDEVDFPGGNRYLALFFHAGGANVVRRDHVARVFEVMDTLRNHTDYDAVCAESDRIAPDGIYEARPGQNRTCEISGIPAFWRYERSVFDEQVANDDDVVTYLSLETYPDGRPVSRGSVMGLAEFDDETGRITGAQSYTLAFLLPNTDEAKEWDVEMLDVVRGFKEQWIAEGSNLRVEVASQSSFSMEFTRTILNDIPLVPVVFFVMSAFTAIVFSKRHKVESRSVLGVAAVVSVLLSVMSGYGLMFIVGVPFTSMTQLLPFLIFGTYCSMCLLCTKG